MKWLNILSTISCLACLASAALLGPNVPPACIPDSMPFGATIEINRVTFDPINLTVESSSTNSFQFLDGDNNKRKVVWQSSSRLVNYFRTSKLEEYFVFPDSKVCKTDVPADFRSTLALVELAKNLALAPKDTQNATSAIYHGLGALKPSQSRVIAFGKEFAVDFYLTTGVASFNYNGIGDCSLVIGANMAASGDIVNVTFAWSGFGVVATNAMDPPDYCSSNLATPAPTNSNNGSTSETPYRYPMPLLPLEFTATIRTSMLESGEVLTMYEAFSTVDRIAKTVVIGATPDLLGRAPAYTWQVFGAEQSAFYYASNAVPFGWQSGVEANARNYFWPDDFHCKRSIFGTDIVSGSVGGLLLVTGTPVYMGEAVVRGIPALVYQSTNCSMIVRWYWANASWSFSSGVSQPLLRIVVQGTGSSPLFVHHPFFQQGKLVPPEFANAACDALVPGASHPQCTNSTVSAWKYYHVHDFLSFVPFMAAADKVKPAGCNDVDEVLGFGSFGLGCSTTNSTLTAVLLVFLIVISCILGCCCQWCRMAPRIREIEEELAEAVTLLHNQQQNGGGGGAPVAAAAARLQEDQVEKDV